MNYTYATLLTSDHYFAGVQLLKASMDSVGTKYPLLVMITNNLSEAVMAELNKLDVKVATIDRIATPKTIMEHNIKLDKKLANTWKDVLTKFQIWNFTEYDKIIMCDCDLMFMKNMDYCFDLPNMTAAMDGEYFGLWTAWPHFNTGFFVLEPDKDTFTDLCRFANSIDPSKIFNYENKPYVLADQELLNLYYDDWAERKELHLSKYCNIFAPHTHKRSTEDVKKNAQFIHFVGGKPWATVSDAPPTCNAWVSLYFYAVARALLIEYQQNGYKFTEGYQYRIDIECLRQLVTYFMSFKEAKEITADFIAQYGETPELVEISDHCEYVLTTLDEFELLKPLITKMYETEASTGNETARNYSIIETMTKLNTFLYKERLEVLAAFHAMYNSVKKLIFTGKAEDIQ